MRGTQRDALSTGLGIEMGGCRPCDRIGGAGGGVAKVPVESHAGQREAKLGGEGYRRARAGRQDRKGQRRPGALSGLVGQAAKRTRPPR